MPPEESAIKPDSTSGKPTTEYRVYGRPPRRDWPVNPTFGILTRVSHKPQPGILAEDPRAPRQSPPSGGVSGQLEQGLIFPVVSAGATGLGVGQPAPPQGAGRPGTWFCLWGAAFGVITSSPALSQAFGQSCVFFVVSKTPLFPQKRNPGGQQNACKFTY